MGITTIATAHSPLITATSVSDAFALLRDLPDVAVPPVPNQAALEDIRTATVNAAV
jgi:hypothetical protein